MAYHRFTRDEILAAPWPEIDHERPVPFQDVDAAGVVFFARYLEYFHDALLDRLERRAYPLAEVLAAGEPIAPLKHAEADYRRPLRFGERFRAAIVLAHFEETQLTLAYRIERLPERELVAWGQTVHVAVEPATFTRTAVPEALRRALS